MNKHEELFDYAPILLKMDELCKELHTACLHKKYAGAVAHTEEMIVQARMLRAWLNGQLDQGVK